MDVSTPSLVSFKDIADNYIISVHDALTVCYTVDASVSPSVRDWVGIFRDGWQSTKECITYEFSPLPIEYQPDRAVDYRISFHGEKLSVSVQSAGFYHFCYISSTDQVLGKSRSFCLMRALPVMNTFQSLSTKLSYDSGDEDEDEDFVEIEDEDGEIVVIKSKTTFLEEELLKANSNIKILEEELLKTSTSVIQRESELEADKTALSQLANSLQEKLNKLTEENESLQRLMTEKTSELQRKIDISDQELNKKQQENDALRMEISRLKNSVDLVQSGVAADSSFEHLTHDVWSSEDGAACSESSVSVTRPTILRPPDHLSVSEPHLPDIVSCSPGADAAASPSFVQSPSGLGKLGWKNKISGVGLNMFCHFKNLMDDTFGTEGGGDMDEMESNYVQIHRSADGASNSEAFTEPCILRPPTSNPVSPPHTPICCPFCNAAFYHGSHSTPQNQQLLDHILNKHCS